MKKNILIYDDDEEIALLCKIVLRKYDYTVETLNQCFDVLADVDKFKPDFILMDLWIPTLGGEKAIEILKNNPVTKHIPIFMFSANAEIENISKKINADGFIAKPFDLKAFVEVINNYIR